MTRAATLMVQGTSSSVGKSILVTALCRIFANAGLRVAPFKAQNMSLNAAVTPDGLEIGRAQFVQAEAARVTPRVEMNPILLKPEGDRRSQLVLMGKAVGHVDAASYFTDDRTQLKQAIADSLQTLRKEHDVVVIEGAGSPAEVNLKARDLTNMYVAELADAPVLLVGDIERGGVFAALIGTLALLEPAERERVAGLVVNKFRGDPALFADGVSFLQAHTGKRVLGVIPYVPRLRIADEDSQSLDERVTRVAPAMDKVRVAVLRLPRISNHDDVLPLEHDSRVALTFVTEPEELEGADLVIVPGTKSTLQDLAWMRARGLEVALRAHADRGGVVLGICGGCQMLGDVIEDPDHVEHTEARVHGLGLLPLRTTFSRTKRTAQVAAQVNRVAWPSWLQLGDGPSEPLSAYVIHHGRVSAGSEQRALFSVASQAGDGEAWQDGWSDNSGHVVGTMLHGVLHNPSVRDALVTGLMTLRRSSTVADGLKRRTRDKCDGTDPYEALSRVVAAHLDVTSILQMVGRGVA